jgi:hypothetical protein
MALKTPCFRSHSSSTFLSLLSTFRSLRKIGVGVAICTVLALTAVSCHFAGAQTGQFGWNSTNILTGDDGQLIASDANGDLYILGYTSQAIQVWKETPSNGGYVQSIVTSGGLVEPSAIAVDGIGNVYLADLVTPTGSSNSVVYKETLSNGTYTRSTVVTGPHRIYALATDAQNNFYLSGVDNSDNYTVSKETLSGSNYTRSTVTNTGLTCPTALTVDGGGNVYVDDPCRGGNIFKETLSGGGYTQSTVLSNLPQPVGIAVDGNDTLYVANNGGTVLAATLITGVYVPSTIATGLSYLQSLAMDGNGNLYPISGYGITELTRSGANFGTISIGITSPTVSLVFSFLTGGTLGSPAVLTQGAATGGDFADAGTGTCTTNGTSHTYSPGDSCTMLVTFSPKFAGARYGAALAEDSSGNILATGYLYGVGAGPQAIFLPGTESVVASSPGLTNPQGVTVDGSGNVYIADYTNRQVLKETMSGGTYTLSTVASADNGLGTPEMVAVDGSGNVYIADSAGNKVWKETLSGGGYTQSTVASSQSGGLASPSGVAIDGSGNVYIADTDNNRVLKETWWAGVYTQSVLATSTLSHPFGVAVDVSGNVYITDSSNNRVLKEMWSSGVYAESTVVSSGLNFPVSVEVDGNGNLYITDYYNNRVLKETPSDGSYSQSTVTTSPLLYPFGVAVDGSGNIYIVDTNHKRVLKEDLADAPTLNFAATKLGLTSTNSPQTEMVENIGSSSLTIPTPTTGLNPSISSGYTLDNSSTCPQLSTSSSPGTLAPGASCTYAMNFTPTLGGPDSGSLALTDNNLNAIAPNYVMQSIMLSGIGILPEDSTSTVAGTLPNLITLGQAITIRATVSDTTTLGTVPTGGVMFTDSVGGTTVSLNTGVAVTLSGGTATLTNVILSGAGAHTVTASYVGVSGSFAASTGTAAVTLNQVTPTISWAAPTAISYGTALSGSQLAASSSVAGKFTYSPAAGVILNAGTQALSVNFTPTDTTTYAAATASVQLIVSTVAPTLSLAPIVAQVYGDTPLVSATSNSAGAITYAVVSGPATISGATVTLTGVGTVVLSASQAASGNYAPATLTTKFTVAVAFTIGATASDTTATVQSGGEATYTFTLTPQSMPVLLDPVTLSASGLPAGATATFSPATAAKGSGTTSVTLTIQTSGSQTARNEKPSSGGSLGSVALGFLLLPLVGLKQVRKRLRQMPRMMLLFAIAALSLGAMVALSGCNISTPSSVAPQTYAVAVTANDVIAGGHATANVTLIVQ